MIQLQRPKRRSSGSGSSRRESNERIVLYGVISVGLAAYFLWTAVVPGSMVWYGRLIIVFVICSAIFGMVNWAITTETIIQFTREYRRMKESHDRKVVALAQIRAATQRRLSDNQTRLGLAQLTLQRVRLVLERQIGLNLIKFDQRLTAQRLKQLPMEEPELDPYIDVELD